MCSQYLGQLHGRDIDELPVFLGQLHGRDIDESPVFLGQLHGRDINESPVFRRRSVHFTAVTDSSNGSMTFGVGRPFDGDAWL